MTTDQELLRRYATDGSQEAFAELVQRHLDLVYSAALRQLNGDAHLARDAAQQVFVDLARKARMLAERPVLAGWLFMGTRFAAAKLVRGEQRRRAREKEAYLMNELTREETGPADWARVRPVLDEALGELPEADRDAILLRYFENRPFAEVGARLGLAENAARMRVDRAVDKLRARLGRQGVTSSAGALATALAAQGVAAAPTGLAGSIAASALGASGAAAAAAGGGWAVLGFTKLQAGLSLGLAAAGASGLVWQQHAGRELERELAALRQDVVAAEALRRDHAALERTAAEAAGLRQDDAALGQLQEEALELKRRLELAEAARARADAYRRQAVASGTATGPFDLSRVDRLPSVLRREPPKYPAELLAEGIAGTVVIRIVVDANGRVRDAFPAKSTRPEFELPALEAVRRWEFDPGLKSGRLVNTRMEIPISFSIAGAGPDQAAIAVGEIKPVDNADWF